MIRREHFGNMPDGREISLFILENEKIRADVTDLGAVLVRLFTPDRVGKMADIVLGFASGVPVGGDLENIDEVTLLRALEGRTEL